MSEPYENRVIARNWREYLVESKKSFQVFIWVWRDLIGRSSKRLAIKMLIAGFAATLLSIGQAWPFAWVINGVVVRNLRQTLSGLALFTGCLLLSQLFQFLYMTYRERMVGENIAQRNHKMNELFFSKSLGQHMRNGSVLSAGNMEKGKGKVNHIQDMMLFNGVSVLLDLTIVYIFIWTFSPVAGLAMTGLIAVYALTGLHLNQRCIETCTPIDHEYSRYNRRQAELWEKVERVKSNGKEREEVEHDTSWIRSILKSDLTFWLWFIRFVSWRGFSEKLVLVGIIGFGVWRVWCGDWTIGLLYPLFSWCSMFSSNLWRLSAMEHEFNAALPSVKAMQDALTMPSDITDKVDALEIPSGPLSIRFQAVTKTYTETDNGDTEGLNAVLKRVSFGIAPGEKVALIGPSGAGKTTIIRLLQRYMDPDEGRITIAGHDLRDYRLASWTAALAYIPQQAQVLDGTIRSNLTYGLPEEERAKITDAELWELMHKLRINFGSRLAKDGLETKVGRSGIKLSGGEAQRLMVGAAAMRKPRFILIDEATSSLDSTTEKAVQRGLKEILKGDMSALIIAHRLSTVRHLCSKFVVLKPSSLVGDGEMQVEAVASSFEELYVKSTTFQRLAQDQDIQIRPIPHRWSRGTTIVRCRSQWAAENNTPT